MMLDYIIIHCIDFDDDGHLSLVEELGRQLRKKGKTVDLFHLPNSRNMKHWAALALYDFTRYCECLVCVGFPAAMSEHKRHKVIIMFEEDRDYIGDYNRVVRLACDEAFVIDFDGDSNVDVVNKTEAVLNRLLAMGRISPENQV